MIRTLRKEDWFHADGFPIEVARRDPQEPFGLHAHEFSEIVIITCGSGLHVTEAESWVLSAGDVFVIGGSQPHDYLGMQDLHLINILFDPRELDFQPFDVNMLPGYHALFALEPAWRTRHQFMSRLRLNARDLAHVEGLVDMLDDELRTRNDGFRFLAMSHFMHLVGILSRCYTAQQHPNSQSLVRIAETIAHLEKNYHKGFNLDQLSDIAGMPRRSFIRAFKAATSESPIAYLIQLRVRKAAELLRRNDLSVTDVAYRVGFQDSNYFSRQFRSVIGLSPGKYRSNHLSEAASL